MHPYQLRPLKRELAPFQFFPSVLHADVKLPPKDATATKIPSCGDHAHPYQLVARAMLFVLFQINPSVLHADLLVPELATATKIPSVGDHAHAVQLLPVSGEVVESNQSLPLVLYAPLFVGPLFATATKRPS